MIRYGIRRRLSIWPRLSSTRRACQNARFQFQARNLPCIRFRTRIWATRKRSMRFVSWFKKSGDSLQRGLNERSPARHQRRVDFVQAGSFSPRTDLRDRGRSPVVHFFHDPWRTSVVAQGEPVGFDAARGFEKAHRTLHHAFSGRTNLCGLGRHHGREPRRWPADYGSRRLGRRRGSRVGPRACNCGLSRLSTSRRSHAHSRFAVRCPL